MYANISDSDNISVKKGSRKSFCICCAVFSVITLIIVVAAVLALIVVFVTQQPSDNESEVVSYNLHVNPADPVVLSAKTPEGDLISVLGNKSASGEPLTINEFVVENEEDGSVFVSMNSDGTVDSGQNRDGLIIDFNWDDNDTAIAYASIIFENGTQQLSIKINLTEPIEPENFISFLSEISGGESTSSSTKRSLSDMDSQMSASDSIHYTYTPVERVRRQSGTQNYAEVVVNVETCGGPEPNARLFADVLFDYDQGSKSYKRKAKYWGMKSVTPGEYRVHIPTSKVSVVGEKLGNICDKINTFLGKACDTYSKIDKFIKQWTWTKKHDADKLLCFYLGKSLRLAFPALRLIPVYRLCRNIFKPFKAYCNNKYINKEIPNTNKTIVDFICEKLPQVDNGIDFLKETDVLFTPTAIFPLGNQVAATGQVFTIPPGMSTVPHEFTISDGDDSLRITAFIIDPFDPLPGQYYVVTVAYNCYLTSTFTAAISIVGTDGYLDNTICYTGPTCELYVPGAAALVRDDVNVYIQNGQSSTSRMVVIIF